MTNPEQILLEYVQKQLISEIKMDFLVDLLEKNPTKYCNLYLWSIECRYYELTDYILTLGFNPNNDPIIYNEMILSFEYSRKDSVIRIIQDGFIIDNEFLNEVRLTIPTSKHFDYELLEQVILNGRKKKINKILSKIKTAV